MEKGAAGECVYMLWYLTIATQLEVFSAGADRGHTGAGNWSTRDGTEVLYRWLKCPHLQSLVIPCRRDRVEETVNQNSDEAPKQQRQATSQQSANHPMNSSKPQAGRWTSMCVIAIYQQSIGPSLERGI